MVQPSPSWQIVPVYATWRDHKNKLRQGSYTVECPVRVTSPTDDVIFPAGQVDAGPLNLIDDGRPSLNITVPASDDPDISPNGWQLTITISLVGAKTEVYTIPTPLAALNYTPRPGINLRTVEQPQLLPAPTPVLIRGVPGGLATLDKDGDVTNAKGEKVLAGHGGNILFDTDNVPYFSTAATSGGGTIALDIDGVPYIAL